MTAQCRFFRVLTANFRADAIMYSESNQLEALKARHKSECKGLVVQIKYLKAKWVRESTLRSDLGYQKQYLLVLLTRCERKWVMSDVSIYCFLIKTTVFSERKRYWPPLPK